MAPASHAYDIELLGILPMDGCSSVNNRSPNAQSISGKVDTGFPQENVTRAEL
jgi:hypothetical protein